MQIVILGAGGRLGAALMREYRENFGVVGFNRAQMDLSNFDEMREKLGGTNFDILINAAAFTNVDLCETQRDQAFRINAEAPRILAEICRDRGAKLIHFSTDYVFDGEKREPYREEDEARPISGYGESKLAGEKNVFATEEQHLVIRVSWVFGPDRPSFIDAMIKRGQEHEEIDAVADKISTPTYTHDISEMLPQFFGRHVDGGIWHFANTGECSWQEYAQFALDCCQEIGLPLKANRVGALKVSDMKKWIARRPVYSVLSSAKYTELTGKSPRTWREAVSDYIRRSYSKK